MNCLRYLFVILLFSTKTFAHNFQGELNVLVVDDFDKKKSTLIYKLDEGGQKYTLDLPASVNTKGWLSGDRVMIDGQELAGFGAQDPIIKVNSISRSTRLAAPIASPFVQRKTLVLIADFKDLKSTVSVDDVDKVMYLSDRSTRMNYLLSSFGRVEFVRDTNNDGKGDIERVTINYNAQGCDVEQWTADAKVAAAQKGVNLSLYQHFMLVIPTATSCSWGGLGYLGCGTTCNTWVKSYPINQEYAWLVYSHELGHNLGMHHSATDLNNDGVVESEYGDAACNMGTGDFKYLKQVNAPHRDQMRWFDAYANKLKTVNAEGTFTLSPLDSGLDRTALLALKISKNSRETYYVSFRKNVGFFGPGAPEYLDKVNIHRVISGDSHSYFIKTIGVGESFVDEKNNIKITVNLIFGDFAVVYVKK